MAPDVVDTIERLLRCLLSPMDTRVLGTSLVRELHYRLLCSPVGSGWAALAAHNGREAQLRRVIAVMAHQLADNLGVTALAREAGMSPSAFFQSFRELTGYSPMQYLKTLRLHRARALIEEQGLGSSQTALAVGYASAAQFSREFKRYFGQSPSVYMKGRATAN
jgi:transcriptional regulator GlxA family with amidase domain